jgi:hypothetical protein
MKCISGSLSTKAKEAAKMRDRVPLLVNRFVCPEFKIFEIVTEYAMCGADMNCNGKVIEQNIEEIARGIMIAFWNGNGIYVAKNL